MLLIRSGIFDHRYIYILDRLRREADTKELADPDVAENWSPLAQSPGRTITLQGALEE
jgi:hypothetical protein